MVANNEWRVVKLGDVAAEVTVGYVGPMVTEYSSSGIPFLRSQNVKPFVLDLDEVVFIKREFHDRIRKSALHPGDVVIVRTGRPGAAAVIPASLSVANCADLVVVRPGPDLDARFLMYYVNAAAHHHIYAHTVGAVQQHFNVGSAKSLELKCPSLTEQRAIAGILGALDDKIELLRSMNRTLGAIAKALFKSWFVDFEPVTANSASRQSSVLCRRITHLFPSHFIDSVIGPIPQGWRVTRIGEAVRVVGGSTPSTNEPRFWKGGDIAWATPKDLSRLTDPVLLSTERRITPDGVSQISSGLLPVGTVLMSSRAPIGYLAISEVAVAVNQGFIAMICDGAASNHYVLCWADENMDEVVARAGGTTFAEISKASFRSVPFLVPDAAVLGEFRKVAGHLHERRVANLREELALAGLRDSLLPRLLTGEIRLRHLEATVEEAV